MSLRNGRHVTRPRHRFPIPMRGNEVDVPETLKVPRREFPIPMRGNEPRVAGVDAEFGELVPDPHEG